MSQAEILYAFCGMVYTWSDKNILVGVFENDIDTVIFGDRKTFMYFLLYYNDVFTEDDKKIVDKRKYLTFENYNFKKNLKYIKNKKCIVFSMFYPTENDKAELINNISKLKPKEITFCCTAIDSDAGSIDYLKNRNVIIDENSIYISTRRNELERMDDYASALLFSLKSLEDFTISFTKDMNQNDFNNFIVNYINKFKMDLSYKETNNETNPEGRTELLSEKMQGYIIPISVSNSYKLYLRIIYNSYLKKCLITPFVFFEPINKNTINYIFNKTILNNKNIQNCDELLKLKILSICCSYTSLKGLNIFDLSDWQDNSEFLNGLYFDGFTNLIKNSINKDFNLLFEKNQNNSSLDSYEVSKEKMPFFIKKKNIKNVMYYFLMSFYQNLNNVENISLEFYQQFTKDNFSKFQISDFYTELINEFTTNLIHFEITKNHDLYNYSIVV